MWTNLRAVQQKTSTNLTNLFHRQNLSLSVFTSVLLVSCGQIIALDFKFNQGQAGVKSESKINRGWRGELWEQINNNKQDKFSDGFMTTVQG